MIELLILKYTDIDEHEARHKILNSNRSLKVIDEIRITLKDIISANDINIIQLHYLYNKSAKIATNLCGEKHF